MGKVKLDMNGALIPGIATSPGAPPVAHCCHCPGAAVAARMPLARAGVLIYNGKNGNLPPLA